VSIEGAPQPKAAAPASPAAGKAVGSIDDISNDEIDSWLVADKEKAAPESPSGVYSGDTITITAFKGGAVEPAPKPEAATEDSDEGYERLEGEDDEAGGEDEDDEGSDDEMPEDFVDESNPFHVKKKKAEEAASGPAKPMFENTSDAASEILRKMMERRKQQKSS
jgi:hypothetical protein